MRVKATKGDVVFEIELDDQSQMDTALSALARSLTPLAAYKPSTNANGNGHVEHEPAKRRSTAANFASKGRAHPQCCLLGMGLLGKPSTPRELITKLKSVPGMDYASTAKRPEHGMRQIMRGDTVKYAELEDDLFTLTADGEIAFRKALAKSGLVPEGELTLSPSQ